MPQSNDGFNLVMVCTAERGGMRTVIETYEKDGLFDRWNVELIYSHDEGSILKRLYLAFISLVRFVFLMIFSKVSMIHLHAAAKGSFWRKNIFAIVARAFGKPVLLHLHGADMMAFYDSQPDFLKRRISKILTKADLVIVLSDSWANYIQEIAPDAKVQVLFNYVSLPVLGTEFKTDKKVKILFLGVLGHRKGIYDLIEAVKNIVPKFNNFELLVGGNGELEEAQNKTRELGLEEYIHFLGWVSGEAKEQYLKESDLYILPSYDEGLPMGLLEAMSWGKPVISTNVGGIPELIREGVDGFVIEPGNVDQISDSLLKLLSDDAMRIAFGKKSRARIEEAFSDKVVLPQLEGIYTALTSSGKR